MSRFTSSRSTPLQREVNFHLAFILELFTRSLVILQKQGHFPKGKCQRATAKCAGAGFSVNRFEVRSAQGNSVARHAGGTEAPQVSTPQRVQSPHPSPGVTRNDLTKSADHLISGQVCLFQLSKGCRLQLCGVPKDPKLQPMWTPCFRHKLTIFQRLEAAAHGTRRGTSHLRFFFPVLPFPFLASCGTSARSSATALGDPRDRELPFPEVRRRVLGRTSVPSFNGRCDDRRFRGRRLSRSATLGRVDPQLHGRVQSSLRDHPARSQPPTGSGLAGLNFLARKRSKTSVATVRARFPTWCFGTSSSPSGTVEIRAS